MTKMTPPLKWFGSKGAFNGKLAKWIISLMPPRNTWNMFSESHYGGGKVSLEIDPEGVSEIHNDIHGGLMNFWDTLASPQAFGVFCRQIQATPFSSVRWEESQCKLTKDRRKHNLTRTQRAVEFFIFCRQSRAGQMKDYATPTARTRRGMNENVSAWLSAVEGLPEVHARVKRMEFCCMDGTEFIRKFDHPRRLFYCDPPYLQETRTAKEVYEHEMSERAHCILLCQLSSDTVAIDKSSFESLAGNESYDQILIATKAPLQGRFLLSGYWSPMYDMAAKWFGWHRRDFKIANNASGAKTKPTMTECVWTNYKPPES